jgi:hypothetical protein
MGVREIVRHIYYQRAAAPRGRLNSVTTKDRRARTREKLDEQRHLLRNAVGRMSAGDLAEALQIATILRVLIHESRHSIPLLKQLVPNYLDLTIFGQRSSVEENLNPGVQRVMLLSVPISFTMSDRGYFLNPVLTTDDKILVPMDRWWERPSLIIPGAPEGFSRREIILGLAEKEGGAHVDPGVPERYQRLLDCKSLQLGSGPAQITTVNLSRMMVGQAGVEMLDALERNFPRP